MASTSDFRNGMIINFKNELYEIVKFQHVKPGKGGAFVRTKLKNVMKGSVIENTFRAGEKVDEIRLEKHKMEYLYFDGTNYVLMNPKTYEQIEVSSELLGDKKLFFKENMSLAVLKKGDEIISIELPTTVNLKVDECEPAIKGNTVTGATKNAVLETGLKIQVPMFISQNDVVKVDTRSEEYLERV
ncbi:MAG: elongation factor P [Candidatus Cloacimonetes bacterium]|nr:elongation factor P [Candidatus Cloacimonadota bacterium]MBL7108339.1 elongation factor P [Candidatus Cloacimonadota bacterium]